MSKPSARKPAVVASGYETSIARTALAALLVVLGIVWIAVYINVAQDAAEYTPGSAKKPANPLPWMADLEKWNFLIGFGLIFLGLVVAAHKKTPLGRGRGVVVGMLGCFLIGLIWIVLFYFVGNDEPDPGDEGPRAVQPGRRDRLHGGGLRLRHQVGVALPELHRCSSPQGCPQLWTTPGWTASRPSARAAMRDRRPARPAARR